MSSGTVYFFQNRETSAAAIPDLGLTEHVELGHILKQKGIIPDLAYAGSELAQFAGRATMQSMGLDLHIIEDSRLELDGDNAIHWLEGTVASPAECGRTVFAFTRQEAIHTLLARFATSSDSQTETQAPGTFATVFRRNDGLWVPDSTSVHASQLETELIVPTEISYRLSEDGRIRDHLESVIWFGSKRNKQDVHKESDFDVQVILDQPSVDLNEAITAILRDYPEVDLSIMYMKDIFDRQGKVIFHDGTKGIFFMYVLAAGKVLYGSNVYQDIVERLTLDEVRPSILTTIREYLSRLRIMPIQSPEDSRMFKKYSLKLFKDLLLFEGTIPLIEMTTLDNERARQAIGDRHTFSRGAADALSKITNLETNFTSTEVASLLYDYEQIVERICNE